MSASPSVVGDVVVIALEGDIDDQNRDQVTEFVREHVRNDETPKVILDLAHLNSIDSRGLATFITAGRLVNERGGELKICAPRPNVESLLKLTRLYLAFEVFSSRERALEAFGQS